MPQKMIVPMITYFRRVATVLVLAHTFYVLPTSAQIPAPAAFALRFNGVNNWVSVSLNSPPVNNYTLSAWVCLRSGGTFAGTRMAVLSSTACGASIELLIHSASTNDGPNQPQFLELGRCNNFNAPALSTAAIPLNIWTYVAATVDSGNNVSYYINGNPAGGYSGSNLDLSLGSAVNLGDNSGRQFNGILDEVQIWNQALSAAEIQTNYSIRLTGNETGLYAYYRFDEGTGATTVDSAAAAGGSAGTLVNSPAWMLSGAALNALATTNMTEGPSAGSDSVVFTGGSAVSSRWNNTANASWLHVGGNNAYSAEGQNFSFSFDANTNSASRSGTLTIVGQTLTINQAGSVFVAAPLTTLVSGLNKPRSVAVDSFGNIYFADTGNNAIKEWTAANNSVTSLVTGLNGPSGVAVDSSGVVYYSDTGNNTVRAWNPVGGTITALVSAGLSNPMGVGVNAGGDVYIADHGNSFLKKWTAANQSTSVSPQMLDGPNPAFPCGVAVDAAGFQYTTDVNSEEYPPFNNQPSESREWNFPTNTGINGNLTTNFSNIGVDPSGNELIADTGTRVITRWTTVSNDFPAFNTLISGLGSPSGVAVDTAGDLFFADNSANTIRELPRAFVDPSPKLEDSGAGTDSLSEIVPATANLLPPFAPTTDASWLTISGITNDVISFSFAAATTPLSRTAHITVLGQTISVTQAGISVLGLGTTNLLEGPGGGSDSVIFATKLSAWTATNNDSWLHISPGFQGGVGSTNILNVFGTNCMFTFDANPGPTRTGSITIAGQTLTVTQAGSTYVAAGLTTLLASSPSSIDGVALDPAGDVYFANSQEYNVGEYAIGEWVTNDTVINALISLPHPVLCLAADSAGNLYFDNPPEISEWMASGGNIVPIRSDPSSDIVGMAVDGVGSIFYTEGTEVIGLLKNTGFRTIENISGLNSANGMAVDMLDNLYFADSGTNVVWKWTPPSSALTPLVSSGLSSPQGAAVDGSGNVFIADEGNNAIKKWVAASNAVVTLANTAGPTAIAVDGSGNLYWAAASGPFNTEVFELPRTFVDPTPLLEGALAGSDSLPVVLPATANLAPPFAPVSSQSWLTITGETSDVVSFSFTANTSLSNRTANITLLGQSISVTQLGASFVESTMLPNHFEYGSVAWADFNNDGRLDFVLSGGFLGQLWENTTNGFSNITGTAAPGLVGVDRSCVTWADFDNDGWPDFLLTGLQKAGTAPPQFWRNTGGTFTNVTSQIAPGFPVIFAGLASVAWGDFDNDGRMDILVGGSTANGPITQIWRNTGNGFSNVTATVAPGLPGIAAGVVTWIDYDNDGWPDFMIAGDTSGSPIAQIWHNNGGTFSNVTSIVAPGLPGFSRPAIAWGDYDNDGKPDFLITGTANGTPTSQLWHNTGTGFSNVTATLAPGLPQITTGDVAWGDFDNDGLLDFLIAGDQVFQVWRNTGAGFTNATPLSSLPTLTGLMPTSVAWGDFNNDGRLDLLFGGGTGYGVVSEVWQNNLPPTDNTPTAPAGLSATLTSQGAILSWNAASEPGTAAGSLTYNVRAGTTPGGCDILSPLSATNGFRLVPMPGNAQSRQFRLLAGLNTGQTIYWTVQAVDAAFIGGPFAPENNFATSVPTLQIAITNALATISWTPPSPGWILQETVSLSPPDWTNSVNTGTNLLTIPITGSTKFYRLKAP
jgi:sugar lactone lactonase YvrE